MPKRLRAKEPIASELRERIMAELRANPNRKQAAVKCGVSHDKVHAIAVAENIDPLRRTQNSGGSGENPHLYHLIAYISGGMTLPQLDIVLGLQDRTISRLISYPERFTAKWIKERLILKLLETFPEKAPYIKVLEVLASPSTLSVAKIKERVRKDQADFRIAAGMLVRDLREKCGLNFEEAQREVSLPIVRENLSKIEAGNINLASSIYRDALREYGRVCLKTSPEIATPYMLLLKVFADRLKR